MMRQEQVVRVPQLPQLPRWMRRTSRAPISSTTAGDGGGA